MRSKKTKVGIVTIVDYDNYGNRLQNYALDRVLKKMGCKVETFWTNYTIGFRGMTRFPAFFRTGMGILSFFAPLFSGILDNPNVRKSSSLAWKIRRKYHFVMFSRKIKTSRIFLRDANDLRKADQSYASFVVGSDQIWNPKFYEEMNWHFLQGVSPEKKIAYAPSLGVDRLTESQKAIFRNGLQSFDWLSCREEAGASLLEEITGKHVPVVADPTLLLTGEEWAAVERKPRFHNEKRYALLYFLGGISEECQHLLADIRTQYGFEIVDAISKSSEYCSCGPEEFVYLIHNAQVVLTDSFHACVFSSVFERPFLVFNRNGAGSSMNSRMETLFHTLELSGHQYVPGMDMEQVMHPDYISSKALFQKVRKDSTAFLADALKLQCPMFEKKRLQSTETEKGWGI